jgi:hypothetical protein
MASKTDGDFPEKADVAKQENSPELETDSDDPNDIPWEVYNTPAKKRELFDRLKKERHYEVAYQHFNDERVRLLDDGTPRKEAVGRAWRHVDVLLPPKPEPEPEEPEDEVQAGQGESTEQQVEPKGKQSEQDDAQDEPALPEITSEEIDAFEMQSNDWPRDVEWAYERIYVKHVPTEGAPSAGAWNLWRLGFNDPKWFVQQIYSKLQAKSDADQDEETKVRAEQKTIKQRDKILADILKRSSRDHLEEVQDRLVQECKRGKTNPK